tara:strand:- start:106 stop:336 length:231 start_codon:yes stop_codon:yes gene_type:complete
LIEDSYKISSLDVLFMSVSPRLVGTKFKVLSSLGTEIFIGTITDEINKIDIQDFIKGVYVISVGGSIKQTFRAAKQ